MRRFVIEGLSAAPGVSFCGSDGGGVGAASPLRSVLGTAMPFCVVGRDCGDPMTDEFCDAVGEGCALSVSRGPLTVAIAQEIEVGCVSVQGILGIA